MRELDLRFIHIADLHILADPDRRQHGVDTASVLREAIPAINRLRPDFVVAGGDLVGDESEDAYRRLRAGLAEYQQLAARGGWPPLPPGPALAPGDQHEQVPALRARLRSEGDLPRFALSFGGGYDSPLADAVQRFQRRHGLRADGIVGESTRAALNVPGAERAAQPGDVIRLMSTGSTYTVEEVGYFRLVRVPQKELVAGEVGYIIAGIKTVSDTRIRDTITLDANPAAAVLPGFKEVKPWFSPPSTPSRRRTIPSLPRHLRSTN